MICWLTTNRTCNLRCSWCYAREEWSGGPSNMSTATLDNILTVLAKTPISRFILLGGEPTVHPDLPAIINRLKPTKVVLVTNAIALANLAYLTELQQQGLSTVTVSLKGATEAQYRVNTRVAGLHSVEQAIANLKTLGIKYSISVTFSKSLLDNLPTILEWLRSVQAESMSINYCRPVVLNSQVSVEGVPTPEEMANQTVACYEVVKESGIPCAFNFMLPLCLLPREFIGQLVADNSLTTICQLQKGNGLIFTPDGSLIPCNHLFRYHLGRAGVDFHNPEEFERFRKGGAIRSFYQMAGGLPDVRCLRCSLRSRCGGGCFIQYLHYQPDELIIEPFTERIAQ